MFNIGDRVVLTSNKINAGRHQGLFVGTVYTIIEIYEGYDEKIYIKLENSRDSTLYLSNYFLSVADYRKKKLKKINNLKI